MSDQRDLFDVSGGREAKERRLRREKSSHVGVCACGFQGEAWSCEYCKKDFCEDCGSKTKHLCENCEMFYATQKEEKLPPNPDGLSEGVIW